MTEVAGWKIAVVSALNAHFKQASGPSRAGTDWAVSFVRAGEPSAERRVIVRSYSDEVADKPQEKAVPHVLGYVASLLESGWSPEQHQGAPGDLVCPPAAPGPKKKSWWPF